MRSRLFTALGVLLLTGCAGQPAAPPPAPAVPPAQTPATVPPASGGAPRDPLATIGRALPLNVTHRAAWIEDIAMNLKALKLEPSTEHVCAVVAVIEQESGFQVDPVIPGLGAIAWREIDRRADEAGVPPSVVHEVLRVRSPDGRSYAERIDAAHTEKDLSEVFEDFTGSVPLGRTLFASKNPIRTRGPMQVNVAFAERFEKIQPYPFPVKDSIAEELFSRRGSLYFGIAHLLAYPAAYDRYLYRFADYNAGQYASRNAAFQQALGRLAGMPLSTDGALLPAADEATGETLKIALALAPRLDLSESEVRAALEQGRSSTFEQTRLYQRVTSRAGGSGPRAAPYALVPSIRLGGPKIHSHLSTDWYARRVNERFERCRQRS